MKQTQGLSLPRALAMQVTWQIPMAKKSRKASSSWSAVLPWSEGIGSVHWEKTAQGARSSIPLGASDPHP